MGSFLVLKTEPLIRPGDVIVDAISCLPVMDPLANENAGGSPGQLTGAQHAVTVTLAITKAALVHLATGIPGTDQDRHKHTHTAYTTPNMTLVIHI